LLLPLLSLGYINAIELNESFSSPTFPPEMWTVYNQDGGLKTWQRSVVKFRSPSACAAVISESRTLRNDDWLITRRIFPEPGSDLVEYWIRSHNVAKTESLELWVSTAGCAVEDFVYLDGFSFNNSSYQRRTVSLAQFDSMPVYLAFRYCSKGKRTVYLDDILGPSYVPADLGVTAILAPQAYERPGITIFPLVRVKNYGSQAQANFSVSVAIVDRATGDTAYSGFATGDSLAPQTEVEVLFGTSWLTTLGNYLVTATTLLTGDMEPRNDTAELEVTVLSGDIHDVGVNTIIQPRGLIPPGPVTPQVEVENFGTVDEVFPVLFNIYQNSTLEYADTVTVSVPAHSRQTVDFAAWVAQAGVYVLESHTELLGDINPANDTQFGTVEVVNLVHDVGVAEILVPADTVQQNDTLTPCAVIANYGDYSETFTTTFRIGSTYQDTLRLLLGAGLLDTVVFRDWVATELGLLAVSCFTSLVGDVDPSNDTINSTVFVEVLQGQTEETNKGRGSQITALISARNGVRVVFQTSASLPVELKAYDVLGNGIAALGMKSRPGRNEFVWNCTDFQGRRVAPGIYILRLEIGGKPLSRKVVLF